MVRRYAGVCVPLCGCVCVCVCVSIYACVFVRARAALSAYGSVSVYARVCLCLCIHVRVSVSVFVLMRICVCVTCTGVRVRARHQKYIEVINFSLHFTCPHINISITRIANIKHQIIIKFCVYILRTQTQTRSTILHISSTFVLLFDTISVVTQLSAHYSHVSTHTSMRTFVRMIGFMCQVESHLYSTCGRHIREAP